MASPSANSVPTTTVTVVRPSLIDGVKWGGAMGQGVTLTYSFPGLNGASAYAADDYGNEYSSGWSSAKATQVTAFKNALASWAAVANLRFVQVADNATTVGEIRFAYTNAISGSTYAYAYLVGDHPTAGDVWVGTQYYNNSYAKGSYGYATLVHEIGHALGFQHPFDKPSPLPKALDNTSYTVMSYTDYNYFTLFGDLINPSSPMDGDILYMQQLYGPNRLYHTGNDTYSFITPTVMTIWDAGGTDTLSAANQGYAATVRLAAGLATIGPFSGVYNIHIYKTVQIENVVGGLVNDWLGGSSIANQIRGGPGNDSIYAGGGNDSLFGESGNDRLYGETGDDRFYLAGSGQDIASGGAGKDRFIFGELNPGERDTVSDFTSEDEIGLSRVVFTKLGSLGPLSATMFVKGAGASAHDANDHILYDTATGVLSYDADGNGSGAPDALAMFTGRPAIALADLLVV